MSSGIPLPSPSDYDTAQDAVWENRAVSLTRKDVTWPYNTRSEFELYHASSLFVIMQVASE